MRGTAVDRIFEYELVALKLLQENGGRLPSRDLVRLLENKLSLTPYERSLNNSGQPRWLTNFRFNSIGLVKANIIAKAEGFWKLINEPKIDIDSLTVSDVKRISDTAYQEWKNSRDGNGENKDVLPQWPEQVSTEGPVLKIEPRTISFDDLLKGVDKSLIQVPPFQRAFVWSPGEICFLLDSIYHGYPIGSFIFWKTTRRLPHHRLIGGLSLNEVQAGLPIDYVLDGQQRITSLYAAVRSAAIQGEQISFYFNLNGQKFQYSRTDESDEMPEITPQIPLKKLFVASSAEYMRYIAKYPDHLQDVLHTLYNRFQMYAFSVIYVREEDESLDVDQNESIKKIVDMFSRINDTGKKLSVVAKMVARCWGFGFDIRQKLDDFYIHFPELEEIREDTLLQTASVILNHRRCRTSDILKSTDIAQLEENWDEIIEAFTLALEFLKNKIKIKNLRYLPFDSVLVPLAYFHYRQHNPSRSQLDQLEKWFWKACLANRYGSSTPANIEEDCHYFDKILVEENVEFPYPIDWESFKSRLVEQDYNLRNAFCKTILALYSYKDPKSFKDNRDIDLKNSLSGYYKHHLHHVFPRKFLEKQDSMAYQQVDSVANIAFSPAITNLEMSDTAPSEYFKQFMTENTGLKDILPSHFIGDLKEYGISDDNFEQFLERRATAVEQSFKDLLGLRSKAEQQFETEPTKPIDLIEAKLRNLILESLTEEFGPAFWEDAIPVDIRIAVKKKGDEYLRAYPYDNAHLDNVEAKFSYLDIMDYAKIISTNWELFEPQFHSRGEIERHFLALKNYRNSIKHNRDMNPVEKRMGEAAVLWFEGVLSK
jgi:hypothetical protein